LKISEQLISITVKLAGIEVSFKVAGPKAASLMASANMEFASVTSQAARWFLARTLASGKSKRW